jgi:hypothetical protein
MKNIEVFGLKNVGLQINKEVLFVDNFNVLPIT